MSELKACPFCGLIIHDPNGIEKTCECPNDMDHMSRALWNTRPIEDALRSTITAQEDVIRRLKEDGEFWLAYYLNDIDVTLIPAQLKAHDDLMNDIEKGESKNG